jgi:hypothetical protein
MKRRNGSLIPKMLFLSFIAVFATSFGAAFAQQIESAPPQVVVIYTIQLHRGVNKEAFEKFITNKVFPTAVNSVDRGANSKIKSQHLLNEGAGPTYLLVVKSIGPRPNDFPRDVQSMYEEVSKEFDPFGTLSSPRVFTVVDSFDVGPRDSLGNPKAEPKRGKQL